MYDVYKTIVFLLKCALRKKGTTGITRRMDLNIIGGLNSRGLLNSIEGLNISRGLNSSGGPNNRGCPNSSGGSKQ